MKLSPRLLQMLTLNFSFKSRIVCFLNILCALFEAVPEIIHWAVPEAVVEAAPESVSEAVIDTVPEVVPEAVPEFVIEFFVQVIHRSSL